MCTIFARSHLALARHSLHPVRTVSLTSFISHASTRPSTQTRQMSGRDQKVIGTHNGTFHCDEALAVFLLRQTSAYASAPVRRTRDPALLAQCSIVVDVGGVYDSSRNLFDHHQREFNQSFGGKFVTKLSSAGLVYKHFGREVVAKAAGLDETDPNVEMIWLKIYEEFIEPIDGNDNGVTRYPSDIQPKYRSGGTDLPARVSRLNPAWNKPSDASIMDAQFETASSLTGTEFMERVDFYANSWLPARALVLDALEKRFQIDSSGRIILFEQVCPWKSHLFDIESSSSGHASPAVLYVVYPDGVGGAWRVQAVPAAAEGFENRKSLPEAWRGLRDDELSVKCGVENAIFVHSSGFIGGNKTREGALKMAKLASTI